MAVESDSDAHDLTPAEERLRELLLRHEEALAADPSCLPPEPPDDLAPDLLNQWRRGCALLERLNRAFVPHANSAAVDGSNPKYQTEITSYNCEGHGLPRIETERVEGSGVFTSDPSVPTDPTNAVSDLLGDQSTIPPCIGRFFVWRKIGSGGVADVFQAFDAQMGRIVALKVPRRGSLTTRDLRRRFLQEAEAAGRLSHPGIVAVYEVGEEGPDCYIATEYCEGPTLAAWLAARTEPMSGRKAAELLASLAMAVQHAHSRGVLHRDIKPTNVLMDPGVDTAAERPSDAVQTTVVAKLCDFGMAKLLEHDGHDTLYGTIIGTPEYMSPEQAQGRIEDLDVTTDIYALGALLYRLLTGQPPFHGATAAGTLHRVVYEEPCAPRRVRPDTPPDLEAICLKCLAKLPEERYATTQELVTDLGRFLTGQPTMARPLQPWQRLGKWVRRRPGIATLAGAAALLAVLLSIVVFTYNRRLKDAYQRESEARSKLQTQIALVQRDVWGADVAKAWSGLEKNRGSAIREYFAKYSRAENEELQQTFAAKLLRRHFDAGDHVLYRHQGAVYAAEFSPDGRQVASAGVDGRICLWDQSKGSTTYIPKDGVAHHNEINCLIFSPDGSQLISGGDDGLVKVWSVPTGELVKEIDPGGGQPVSDVAFSSDGAILAISSVSGVVRLLTGDGFEESPLPSLLHPAAVDEMALSSDGTLLATGCKDRHLRVYDVRSGALVRDWMHGSDRLFGAVSFAHRGNLLVTADLQSYVLRFWNPQSDKPLRTVSFGNSWLHSVAFSHDDRWLAFSNKDGAIALYDLLRGKIGATLFTNAGCVWSVRFSPCNEELLIAGDDGTVRLVDVPRLLECETERIYTVPVVDVTLLRAAEANVVRHDDGRLELSDGAATTRLSNTIATERLQGPVNQLAVAVQSSVVAYAVPGDLRIPLVELSTGRERKVLEGFSSAVMSLGFSPDASQLASGHRDGEVRVWDVTSGETLRSMKTDHQSLWGLSFAAAGRYIVSCGGYRVRAWDAATLDPVAKPIELRREAFCVVAHPLRPLVATNDGDELILWNLPTDEVVRLPAHDREICAMALSPDGRMLVTGGVDGTLWLWDVESQRNVADLVTDLASISSVSFSPDGNTLAATLIPRQGKPRVKIWNVSSPGQPAGGSRSLVDALHKQCPKAAGARRISTAPSAGDITSAYINDFDSTERVSARVKATLKGGSSCVAEGFAGRGHEGRELMGTLRRACGSEIIQLELENLPKHESVDLNFLLAVIDSWDGALELENGPDLFEVRVDGVPVFCECFSNRTDGGGQFYAPAAEVRVAFGESLGFGGSPDALFDMRFEGALERVPHTAPTLIIEWQALRPEAVHTADESWALDNLEIVLHDSRPDPS